MQHQSEPTKIVSPEDEHRAVAAVLNLDWNTDPTARPPASAIAIALNMSEAEAEPIFWGLMKRNIIRQQPAAANNLAETGEVRLLRVKWVRGRTPTTLELIEALTRLAWMPAPLETSRRTIVELFESSMEEAGQFLHELRDRELLELRPAATGSLVERSPIPNSAWRWFRLDQKS